MAGMYSPPPKRRATTAPRTPNSSNSTQKQSGYIVAKGVPITNNKGNKICTVKLQTDESKYCNIKVMLFDDIPDKFELYLGQPVILDVILENVVKFNDSKIIDSTVFKTVA